MSNLSRLDLPAPLGPSSPIRPGGSRQVRPRNACRLPYQRERPSSSMRGTGSDKKGPPVLGHAEHPGFPPWAIDERPFGAKDGLWLLAFSPEGASVNSPGRKPWDGEGRCGTLHHARSIVPTGESS